MTAPQKQETALRFIMVVIVLTMINNLQHCAYVYQEIGKKEFLKLTGSAIPDYVHAFIVVIILDLSVIAFVMNGKHREAGIYAFLLFILNLLYYDGLKIFDVEVNKKIAQAVYSAMFTYSIYRFSYLYFEKKQRTAKEEWEKKLEEREKALEKEKKEAEQRKKEAEEQKKETELQKEELEMEKKNLSEKKEGLLSEIEEIEKAKLESLRCPFCDKPHDSYYSLRGHLRAHSDKLIGKESE